MRNISIQEIVDFRRKSNQSKKKHLIELASDKEKTSSKQTGDYWVMAISGLNRSYKQNDVQLIYDKIEEIEEKYESTDRNKTKMMYKRNISVLNACQYLHTIRPSMEMNFIKKGKDHELLNIQGLQIKVSPNNIFKFQDEISEKIGAIWFIAKLDGYQKEELGMFTDVLYRFLKKYFSEKGEISEQYCIAVDVFKGKHLNYKQFKENNVSHILDSTIEEIKRML